MKKIKAKNDPFTITRISLNYTCNFLGLADTHKANMANTNRLAFSWIKYGPK